MVFLNPAVLLGLIAAGIPVLLHFLNLQKLKRIEFSTLTFLKELQKTKIRKLKFKQWLLLALRVLIILLLVSAFARPTLESVTLGGTSAAKTTSVFIIDDSYSMSVLSGNGSYFNNAKQVVKTILAEMQQGDEAAVIFASDFNENQELTSSFLEIENGLDLASISPVNPDYSEVFQKAGEILNASLNFNKEVYILSDFQRNIAAFLEDNPNVLNNLSGGNTRFYLFDFSQNGIENVTVTDFQLENQILETGKPVNFTANVKNESGGAVSNNIASLFINGIRSAQQSFNLQAGETKSLSFEANLKQNGLIEARLEIEDDNILTDNTRYVSFYVPEQINVLLLTDSREDSYFIKLALTSSSEGSAINITEVMLPNFSSSLLNENDVVILTGSNAGSGIGTLKNYIEGGGNVIIFPGSGGLKSFGNLLIGLSLTPPLREIGELNNDNNPASFDEVEYNHPIFANLFEEREDTKVESPEIYFYYRINPSSSARPIITLADNSLFLSEYFIGKGRVLLFNTAPLLSWSNFPVKSLFAPLVNKSVLYQSLRYDNLNEVNAGEELNIEITNTTLPQIKVIRPGGTEEFINIETLENKRFLTYNKTSETGVYEFYSDDNLINFAAVNFDTEESLSGYLTGEEIEQFAEQLNPDGFYEVIDPNENYNEIIYQARFGTELWKYFLMAALLVALIEMFVSKSARKDLVEIK